MKTIDTLVFDIGNVLLPWDPYRLFEKHLPDAAAVTRFMAEVDFPAWNLQHDAGQCFAVGIENMARPSRTTAISSKPSSSVGKIAWAIQSKAR
jgi:hypothetical protein